MDLSTLSISQLRDLQQQIPIELKHRELQDKANLLNEVRAFARARGYSLEDLVSKESKLKTLSGIKVKVKYRHPEDLALEWTGRGRRPKWVEAWLQSGMNMDALTV